jgi:hypothetical protein
MVCGIPVLTSQWGGRATQQAFSTGEGQWGVARRSPRALLRHEVASFTATHVQGDGLNHTILAQEENCAIV